MAENVINLNKARKTKAKAGKNALADQNAIKFGRSKAEKQRDKTTSELSKTYLDGHKRDT